MLYTATLIYPLRLDVGFSSFVTGNQSWMAHGSIVPDHLFSPRDSFLGKGGAWFRKNVAVVNSLTMGSYIAVIFWTKHVFDNQAMRKVERLGLARTGRRGVTRVLMLARLTHKQQLLYQPRQPSTIFLISITSMDNQHVVILDSYIAFS